MGFYQQSTQSQVVKRFVDIWNNNKYINRSIIAHYTKNFLTSWKIAEGMFNFTIV